MAKLQAKLSVIIVEVDPAPGDHAGIFLLPGQREEQDIGTVVSAGPGEWNEKGEFMENPVKDGDRVLIAKGAGLKGEIELDGKTHEYLYLMPSEITGIIKGEPEKE